MVSITVILHGLSVFLFVTDIVPVSGREEGGMADGFYAIRSGGRLFIPRSCFFNRLFLPAFCLKNPLLLLLGSYIDRVRNPHLYFQEVCQ